MILVLMALTAVSCRNSAEKGNTKSTTSSISLTGAGATFPMPYYNMAFKKYTSATGTEVTYGGIGSGGGIRSLADRIVDFGATDAFLDDEQLASMPAEVVHVPTVIGAVVIAYNLPGIDELRLTGELLEQIFMGEITHWNDPALKQNNPGVEFPDLEINVIHRSDGSGTTQIFSDYMSKVSKRWASEVGTGKALQWPAGMGAKGNPGVAGTISQTTGAIGYVGSEYAFAMKMQSARIQNRSGNYILPSATSVSAAAAMDIPADTRVMITNSDDPEAYPICGFTWIILYKEQKFNNRTHEQAQATAALLSWLLSDEAQGMAEKLHYAPLASASREKAQAILSSLTYDGEPLSAGNTDDKQ